MSGKSGRRPLSTSTSRAFRSSGSASSSMRLAIPALGLTRQLGVEEGTAKQPVLGQLGRTRAGRGRSRRPGRRRRGRRRARLRRRARPRRCCSGLSATPSVVFGRQHTEVDAGQGIVDQPLLLRLVQLGPDDLLGRGDGEVGHLLLDCGQRLAGLGGDLGPHPLQLALLLGLELVEISTAASRPSTGAPPRRSARPPCGTRPVARGIRRAPLRPRRGPARRRRCRRDRLAPRPRSPPEAGRRRTS